MLTICKRLIFSPSPAKAEPSGGRRGRNSALESHLEAQHILYLRLDFVYKCIVSAVLYHRSVGEPAEGSFPRDPNPTSHKT